MVILFDIKNNKVIPKPEILLIYPFKEIWERDKNKNKEKALKEFAYIEFFVSVSKSNPYRGYSEDIRKKKLKEDIIQNKNWKEDKLVKEAIKKLDEFYKQNSVAYKYYISSKKSADKILNFLEKIDFNQIHPKTGYPIYKPKDVTAVLNDIEKVMSKLEILEKKMFEELSNESKVMSDKKISPFSEAE